MPIRKRFAQVIIPANAVEVSSSIVVDGLAVALAFARWPAQYVEVPMLDPSVYDLHNDPMQRASDVYAIVRASADPRDDGPLRSAFGEARELGRLVELAGVNEELYIRQQIDTTTIWPVLTLAGVANASFGGQDIEVNISHNLVDPADWNDAIWRMTVQTRFSKLLEQVRAAADFGANQNVYRTANHITAWAKIQAVYLASHYAALANAEATTLSSEETRRALRQRLGHAELMDIDALHDMLKLVPVLPQHAYKPLRGVYDPDQFDRARFEVNVMRATRLLSAIPTSSLSTIVAAVSLPVSTIPMPDKPMPVSIDSVVARAFPNFAGVSDLVGQLVYFNWRADNIGADAPFNSDGDFTLRYGFDAAAAGVSEHLDPVLNYTDSVPAGTFLPIEGVITHQPLRTRSFTYKHYRVTTTVNRSNVYQDVTLLTPFGTRIAGNVNMVYGGVEYFHDVDELEAPHATYAIADLLPNAGSPFGWLSTIRAQ